MRTVLLLFCLVLVACEGGGDAEAGVDTSGTPDVGVLDGNGDDGPPGPNEDAATPDAVSLDQDTAGPIADVAAPDTAFSGQDAALQDLTSDVAMPLPSACTQASDCPGASDPCLSVWCQEGKCSSLVAEGKPCTAPGLSCEAACQLPGVCACLAPGKCWSMSDCIDKAPVCHFGDCVNGMCQFSPWKSGTFDDQDACTVNEGCEYGIAHKDYIWCGDADPCTANSCDAKTGCVATPTPGSCVTAGGCGTCKAGKCAAPATSLQVDIALGSPPIAATPTADDGLILALKSGDGTSMVQLRKPTGTLTAQSVWPLMVQDLATRPDGSLVAMGQSAKGQAVVAWGTPTGGPIKTVSLGGQSYGVDPTFGVLVPLPDGGLLVGRQDVRSVSRLDGSGQVQWTATLPLSPNDLAGTDAGRIAGMVPTEGGVWAAAAVSTVTSNKAIACHVSAAGAVSACTFGPFFDQLQMCGPTYTASCGPSVSSLPLTITPSGLVVGLLSTFGNAPVGNAILRCNIGGQACSQITYGKGDLKTAAVLKSGHVLVAGHRYGADSKAYPWLVWLSPTGELLGQELLPGQGFVERVVPGTSGGAWLLSYGALRRVAGPPLACP